MPNNFKKLFIELFSEKMAMSSFFQNYDGETEAFVFKKGNDEIVLKLLWSEINDKIYPIFKSVGKVKLYNHVYANGELCHNFVAIPLIDDKTVGSEVDKYVSSIGKYIYSLKKEIKGLVSSIPENDLSELENMMAFGYYVAKSAVSFKVGDLAKVTRAMFQNALAFKRVEEISQPESRFYSPDSFIVKSVNEKKVFLRRIVKEGDEFVENGDIIAADIYDNKYPFQKKQDKKVLLIGLGSLGSFVFQNLLNWPRLAALSVNDPDVFTPKNSARNNFGNAPWMTHKATIAEELVGKLKPSYADFEIDFKAHKLLIGARTSSSHHASILKIVQGVDIIIDATGSDAVFKELANLKNENTIIYKMSLYASGNGMIFGSFLSGDFIKYAQKWNTLRTQKNWDIASAYNGANPAGFLETSTAANHLSRFIYKTCDEPTNRLESIDDV